MSDNPKESENRKKFYYHKLGGNAASTTKVKQRSCLWMT